MSKVKEGATRVVSATWEGERMDLLAKSQWIAKLLDGSVKQTRGTLCAVPVGRRGGKRERRYCCLGVKAILDGIEFAGLVGDPDELELKVLNGTVALFPTPRLPGASSMYDAPSFPNGGVIVRTKTWSSSPSAPQGAWETREDTYSGLASFLAVANDEYRWSFKKIARWIAENL